jgi:Ca-activated chloride channel family protein
MRTRHTPVSHETFGLEAWLESERIVLPLQAVCVNADIAAGFANVEVDQVFEQNNAKPLDCRYTFPLPADAAVYRCEMHVNGRVVLAKVEDRAAAEVIFKEAKERGRRAALATGERDNLFTLQLGNLQPGDTVLMRFCYIQPIQRLREQRSLRVPVNPGVRYIPGAPLLRSNVGLGTVDDTDLVPDASRISPPRINGEHADAAGFHAQARLRGAGDLVESLSSPSHPVVVRHDKEDLAVALAVNGHLPDKDFVLTWNDKLPAAPVVRAWLDKDRRGVLEIRLPAQAAPSLQNGNPCDVYFLLDRSGSMDGDNWKGACKALAAFIPRLHPDTRVWLTLFESTVQDYDAVPVRAADLDLGPDGANVFRHGTAGGTELVGALRHLGSKVKEHSGPRPASVLVITDGQVGNETQVLKAAKELGCPVHVIGVAMTANDELDALAQETGGRAVFLSPGADIPAAVERFAPILRSPVMTNLSLTGGWSVADGSPLRDLVDGEDLIVPLSAVAGADPLAIEGCRSADGTLTLLRPSESTLAGAGLIWARTRIRHLEREGESLEALAVAKEFNLLSKNAAFIAWDEAEKVSIAQSELVQPAFEPAGTRQGIVHLYSTPIADSDVGGWDDLMSRGGPSDSVQFNRLCEWPGQSAFARQLCRFIEELEDELRSAFYRRRVPIALRRILEEFIALVQSDHPGLEAEVAQFLDRMIPEIHAILDEERHLLMEKLDRLNHISPRIMSQVQDLQSELTSKAP